MKIKRAPLVMLLLFVGMSVFANTDGKEKKADPDLNGIIVAAETGRPIKDVNITAYSNSKKEKAVLSSATGNFSLTDLKPGIYKFVFQKEGFEKVIREKIVLKANEDYQLTIQMFEQEALFDLMPSPLRFSGEE